MPQWIRGVIVGSYQLAITIGLLLAAIVNNSSQGRNDTGSYRIPISVQFAWALVLIGGMLVLPETPRYLIRSGRPDKAARSLSKLRRLPEDHEAIREELDEIQANHEYELTLGKASYLDCFRGRVLKRQLTGCFLQGLQQLTGINFIFYYGTQYFKNTGIKNAFVISMITSSVNTLSTIPGLYAIDKWGRRPLLFWGGMPPSIQNLPSVINSITSHRNDSKPTSRRRPWDNHHGSTRRRHCLRYKYRCSESQHSIRLHLHLLLRLHMGKKNINLSRIMIL